MITLENVTKIYRENGKNKYIAKKASFVIPSNKNVAILGAKGSGRTSVLKMLSGMSHPSSGSIDSDKTFSWILGSMAGFKPSISIRQNITFVGRIYGKNIEEISEIIDYIISFTEVEKYMDQPMKEAPIPLRMKVAFALSLSFDFDYMVVDNRIGVGEAGEQFRLASRAALQEKLTRSNLLLVTSTIGDVRDLCDACIVLDAGKLEYFNDVEDGIMAYRKIIKYQPPLLDQPQVKKRICCEDGQVFENVDLVALHYKVKALSVLQALNFNQGSHLFLKKVFWLENEKKRPFHIWPYTIPAKTLLASDGLIFSDTIQATTFYKARGFKDKIDDKHIKEILLKSQGYSEILKIQFFHISEYA